MVSELEIYLLLLFLIFVQTIVGVGILVIGTPALLIFQYNIIDIYLILLPISIFTSCTNILIFFYKNKKLKIQFEKQFHKEFFFICLPSVLFGLILLKEYQSIINFKILVSSIIIFSIFFVNFVNKRYFKLNIYHLILIGTVHGLTNSGGTLLSLFFSKGSNKNKIRYYVTFFYLFLASFQYVMTLVIFDLEKYFLINMAYIPFFLIFGIMLGNYAVKYINLVKFKILINILAVITSLFLIFS